MENTICTRTLVNNIVVYLTGNVNKNISAVKLNNENLLKNGDLFFLLNLKAWRPLSCSQSDECTTILHHFCNNQNIESNDKTESELAQEVFQQLIAASKTWPIEIKNCSLQKERVSAFLNRIPLIENAIRAVLKHGRQFGRCKPTNRHFYIQVSEDKESELTSVRLHILKDITERLLILNGCQISESESTSKYLFTTKSEGPVQEHYKKYICGVVKNSKSNSKETCLGWNEHIKKKIRNLQELNEDKLFEKTNTDSSFKDIATAVVTFELLSIKPNHPVFIGYDVASDRNVTNTKGASFVLYNSARIATILAKYNDKRREGKYPDLPNIYDIDFSTLDQEEEWELVYNFIVGYPQVLRDCIKYDNTFQTSPQVLCIFLSKLCQRFSVYYRKTRILTEGYDHLMPAMFARLHMIKALQIVLQNALAVFSIEPMSQM